ncbi:hypothetical protein CFH99_07990 [Nocardioides aromaticivorans]|uniref:YiaAB two helix domain-containing protein n=1 Tax=Nocardioides aromaticivorans TaxID=200618 RepID=A0ABX7PIL8_9ACTN|nr:hypothetical protein [Nocardioides aromaticivorans]QSR25562.1 hypothetical protein CFH99_07990 [Nocardioides aromaticivorans]
MSEWDGRQVSLGALACCGFWMAGVALIVGSLIGLLPHHWAAAGQVVAMIGCLRTVLRAIHEQERRVHDAFEFGRATADLKIVRE